MLIRSLCEVLSVLFPASLIDTGKAQTDETVLVNESDSLNHKPQDWFPFEVQQGSYTF